jgi:hypothetical protein
LEQTDKQTGGAEMANQRIELKPRDYGGLLDATFDLYRQNFLLVVGISAVVYVPFALVQILLFASPGTSGVAMALAGLAGLISVFLMIFMTGAMTKAVSDVYLGHEATVSGSYGYVLKRWAAYLWTNLLCGLLVLGGVVLCVVPGIILGFWIAFATQVFVLEGRAGLRAIQRSRELIGEGRWVRVLVLWFLLTLMISFIAAIPQMFLQFLIHDVALMKSLSAAWGALTNTFLAPISAIALILLYYDIRIRKEAFDLQVLAQSIAQWGGAEMQDVQQMPAFSATTPADPAAGATDTGRFCSSCGRELAPEAAFCEHCGQRDEPPTESGVVS